METAEQPTKHALLTSSSYQSHLSTDTMPPKTRKKANLKETHSPGTEDDDTSDTSLPQRDDLSTETTNDWLLETLIQAIMNMLDNISHMLSKLDKLNKLDMLGKDVADAVVVTIEGCAQQHIEDDYDPHENILQTPDHPLPSNTHGGVADHVKIPNSGHPHSRLPGTHSTTTMPARTWESLLRCYRWWMLPQEMTYKAWNPYGTP